MKITNFRRGLFWFFSFSLPIVIALALVNGKTGVLPQSELSDFSQFATSSVPLSQEKFKILERELAEIVEKEDPRSALNALSKVMESDSDVLDSCHPLVHSIGHEAFEKYKDFSTAMSYQDELCNSGYIHGVMEYYFENENIESAMVRVCDGVEAGTFKSWQCFHGVGHGLMFSTDNNLPRSIKLCQTYHESSAALACVSGVFMENFNVDGKAHISSYVNPKDPLKTCREADRKLRDDCYVNEPIYFLGINQQDYAAAFHHCLNSWGAINHTCAIGVGTQLAKYNLSRLDEVASYCVSAGRFRDDCIKGAVTILFFHHGRKSPVKAFCGTLIGDMREICFTRLTSIAAQFSDVSL